MGERDLMKRFNNQQGLALTLVLALMVIATILGFAVMNVVDAQTLMVSRHQQREQALHFAEAGIHSYMAQLSKDSKYYKTTAMQNTNTPFESAGYFRLTVDAPNSSSPYVIISSTGWANNSDIKRTVEVKLQKKEFVRNLITTNVGGDRFWYTNRFIRGDVINGPLHMNGDLVVDGYHGDGQTGPVFTGPVTYSGNFIEIIGGASELIDAIDIFDWLPNTDSTVDFQAGNPVNVDRMGLPSSNENLKTIANYVFNGRTCIHIENSSVKVKDKEGAETTLTIPEDGLVIYVEGTTGNNKWSKEIANVYMSGVLNGRLTIAAENDIYITANDPTIWNNPGTTTAAAGGITYADLGSTAITSQSDLETALLNCNDMLGLIANRNVRILHYNWPKAGGSWYGTRLDVAPTTINIHASIFAVTGSFEYEEHTSGSTKGNVNLIGSITQYKTGPLAGFAVNLMDLPAPYDILNERSSGYGKNYWHDPRLMYELPPNFLEPTNSGWEIIEWREKSNPSTLSWFRESVPAAGIIILNIK